MRRVCRCKNCLSLIQKLSPEIRFPALRVSPRWTSEIEKCPRNGTRTQFHIGNNFQATDYTPLIMCLSRSGMYIELQGKEPRANCARLKTEDGNDKSFDPFLE